MTGLRYPGLPGDPAHALASRQMRRFGGVLSCTLPDAAVRGPARRGVRRWSPPRPASAACTPPLDRRAQWGGDAVAEGFVRISAGCEDAADLVADLTAALDAAGT